VGFSAAAGPLDGCEAVYRFFHKTLGTHFYTASAAERDFVNAQFGAAYLDEGVAYYVPTTREADPYQ
jgi:hypothetical protein